MEKYTIENDIHVFCITAESFPEGVLQAHEKLHSLVPYSEERKYFGLSRPEKDKIVYKAAAEEIHAGEAEKLGLEKLVIKKGEYISTLLKDYKKDIPSIGRTFQDLIHYKGIDPEGYCVEWYINFNDMWCMVRLKDRD